MQHRSAQPRSAPPIVCEPEGIGYRWNTSHRAKLGSSERPSSPVIPARLVVLALTPTRFSIADPSDAGMLDIAGFSSDVPQLVNEFSRGF